MTTLAEALHYARSGDDGGPTEDEVLWAKVAEAYLNERHYIIQFDWQRQQRVEHERWKREREEQRRANLANAPVYAGAIKRCMASVSQSRGAPYRCGTGGKLYLRQEKYDGDAIVVCRAHARAEHVFSYSGWAGDPNPHRDIVEPAEAAKLVAE